MRTMFVVAALFAAANAQKQPKGKKDPCQPEVWKFKCSELMPDAPANCNVVYNYVACDDFAESDTCTYFEGTDKGMDCMEMFKDPEVWDAVKYNEVWFWSDPIAYDVWWRWDDIHSKDIWDQDWNEDEWSWDEEPTPSDTADWSWDEEPTTSDTADWSWDEESDTAVACEYESWSRTCQDFDPEAPPNCDIMYVHDTCGVPECSVWAEEGYLDCLITGFVEPAGWEEASQAPVWDDDNKLTL